MNQKIRKWLYDIQDHIMTDKYTEDDYDHQFYHVQDFNFFNDTIELYLRYHRPFDSGES